MKKEDNNKRGVQCKNKKARRRDIWGGGEDGRCGRRITQLKG